MVHFVSHMLESNDDSCMHFSVKLLGPKPWPCRAGFPPWGSAPTEEFVEFAVRLPHHSMFMKVLCADADHDGMLNPTKDGGSSPPYIQISQQQQDHSAAVCPKLIDFPAMAEPPLALLCGACSIGSASPTAYGLRAEDWSPEN